MSDSYNTDGLYGLPPINQKIQNVFDSIECTIAFDVRDWSEDRRSAWIYAIIFGLDDESWNEMFKRFRWDNADRQRAESMHEQWKRAKRMEETK